jgi:hypothetical protein
MRRATSLLHGEESSEERGFWETKLRSAYGTSDLCPQRTASKSVTRVDSSNRSVDHMFPPFSFKPSAGGRLFRFSEARPWQTGLKVTVPGYSSPRALAAWLTRFTLANRDLNGQMLQSQHHLLSNASATSPSSFAGQLMPDHGAQSADRVSRDFDVTLHSPESWVSRFIKCLRPPLCRRLLVSCGALLIAFASIE